MEITTVPVEALADHGGQVVNIGPPPTISEDECGIANTLVCPETFGGRPTRLFRTYWRPDAEELATLNDGGLVVIEITGDWELPHRAAVQAVAPALSAGSVSDG